MTYRSGGLWFEELPVGLTIDHAITRTVTETDNLLFTTMTHNPQPLHLDAEFAGKTDFGKLVVNSMYTLALVVGISVGETTHGTTIANLGFNEIVFPNPVFIGDTLRVQTEVKAARLSQSKPNAGIVTFEHRANNQNSDLVCRAQRDALMIREPQT